ERANMAKLITRRACFLAQLLAGHILWLRTLPVVQAARRNLQAPIVHRIAILPDHHHLAVGRDRHYPNRASAFAVRIDDLAVPVALYSVLSHLHPFRDERIASFLEMPA